MPTKKLRFRFARNFLWGAGISPHQVEGGNHNQWTEWELETAQVKAAQAPYKYKRSPVWPEIEHIATKPENYVSDKAADHFNRYQHDIALAQRLHLSTLKVGIEWSRIEPREGEFDKVALLHYKKYLHELRAKGFKPVLALWHWTTPVWFEEKGGFTKRRNVKYFKRYVQFISQQLGVYFEYVVTLNEPTTYAAQSYHEGNFPPQKESKILMLYVLLNLAKAHRASYKIIKKIRPRAKVGVSHNCTYFYTGDDSFISKVTTHLCHYFANEWFINRVKRQQDFLGLNWYWAQRICGTRAHAPDVPKSDVNWTLQPEKLEPMLVQLYERYKMPVFILESGVADQKDVHRQWWISEQIKAMDRAIANNVPLLGYMYWSLLDNFEWADGFWPRFGLIEVNYQTMQRKPRQSALWYGRFIKVLQENN